MTTAKAFREALYERSRQGRDAIGVITNSHGLQRLCWQLTDARADLVVVYYRAQQNGRAYQCAAWVVSAVDGSATDPGGYWRDYGHKVFDVYRREQREPQRLAALAWAAEKFDVPEWVKGPFGDYHNKTGLEAARKWTEQ